LLKRLPTENWSVLTEARSVIESSEQLSAVLFSFDSQQMQLKLLIMLDIKPDLIKNLKNHAEIKEIFLNYNKFTLDSNDPLSKAKAILSNYIQPSGLGKVRLFSRNDACLEKVKKVLDTNDSSTIDELVSKVVGDVGEIKEKDPSLYHRLQYICALGEKPLKDYSAKNLHNSNSQ